MLVCTPTVGVSGTTDVPKKDDRDEQRPAVKHEEEEDDIEKEESEWKRAGQAQAQDKDEIDDEDDEDGQAQADDKPKLTLCDLPVISGDAFTNYDSTVASIIESNPPPMYLASFSDIPATHYTIPLERKRCLIRALTSSSSSSSSSAVSAAHPSSSSVAHHHQQSQSQPRKRPAPSSSASSMTLPGSNTNNKRPRWTNLDSDRKTACLTVALNAAYKCNAIAHRPPSQSQLQMQNPTASDRHTLAKCVPKWSTQELREYMNRAGLRLGSMARHEMIATVSAHLTPDLNPSYNHNNNNSSNNSSSNNNSNSNSNSNSAHANPTSMSYAEYADSLINGSSAHPPPRPNVNGGGGFPQHQAQHHRRG